MDSTISTLQLQNLRNEFGEYLRAKHPDWQESTVSTVVLDAFFALRNDVGIDFWESLASEEGLSLAHVAIRDYFAGEERSGHAEERANGCASGMRELKAFLDERHPALAGEWTGKTVSDAYLKAEFRAWMHWQRKAGGEHYSPATINSYVSALKNSVAKLHLEDEISSDLFYYTTPNEFEEVRKRILADPKLHEVGAAAGNEAFSNAMNLYARFLQERGQPACWIFQSNPKYYDVVGALESSDTLTLPVNQYPKQIKKGDRAYIWVPGADAGIMGAGTILCDPEVRESPKDDPFWRAEPPHRGSYPVVDVHIDRRLIESRILRSVLLADERTKRLEILTYSNAANYRVAKDEEAVIESIINGTYQRVPAVEAPALEGVEKKRYWLYSPGKNAAFWEEFLRIGVMGIGWDELGDLRQYKSKSEIRTALRQVWGEERSYTNIAHALWQFAYEMQPGDIVFAKRGLSMIIGRGVVESDYSFDDQRKGLKHVRKVSWTHQGEWEHPGQAASKTLTDITPYTEYVQTLESLVTGEQEDLQASEPEAAYPDYSAADFLSDVFMSPERYESLKALLRRKKNVILQGPPGVGKTFVAQRLAFSMMGAKDTSRLAMVQFHQSYSYEDFVMGYRPDGIGFRLVNGPFYEFCKRAEEDDREYFFIIDEINRGNLSKILGELLMLIESDKRGEANSIRLLYSDEQFYVPENVYVIGMMNTADRSLAMIDYALRRRFAFFDLEPAFLSEGFRAYQNRIRSRKFDALIETVEELNEEIRQDASLGAGFRIGHSYFCNVDTVDDGWLTGVVEFELLSLLSEYWFDEPSKLERWSLRLRGALRGG